MKLNDLDRVSGSRLDTEKYPVLFIGHGSPMNAIDENEFVRGWREIGKTLPRPEAILCISAHWETKGTFVTAMERPKTIHDFGGFPRELYEVQYPAPGSPEYAGVTKNSVSKAVIGLDYNWGLDHGCWSVVRRLYPDADVPVFEMSLDYYQPAKYHFELAKELIAMRRRGVLIVGSGNMIHNLGLVAWEKLNEPEYFFDWAAEAGHQMKKYILSGDFQHLIDYKSLGDAVNLAVPTPEHYLPMLYALALKEGNETISLFNDKAVGGSLSMTSFKIS